MGVVPLALQYGLGHKLRVFSTVPNDAPDQIQISHPDS